MWAVWIVAYFLVRNDYVLPSFWETFAEMGRIFAAAAFWRAFAGTMLRTAIAFLSSLALGIALALAAVCARPVRAFLAPVISVLRTVPTMAVILALLLWTNPLVAPVLVALLVLFPAFYAATLASLDEINEEYADLARAFRVPPARRVFRMYAPLAAPAVLKQSGSIFSMGLKITVSGEVLSNTYRSIGGLMQEAKMFVEMPALMALTLVTVAMGFALEGLCLLLYRAIVRWRA